MQTSQLMMQVNGEPVDASDLILGPQGFECMLFLEQPRCGLVAIHPQTQGGLWRSNSQPGPIQTAAKCLGVPGAGNFLPQICSEAPMSLPHSRQPQQHESHLGWKVNGRQVQLYEPLAAASAAHLHGPERRSGTLGILGFQAALGFQDSWLLQAL